MSKLNLEEAAKKYVASIIYEHGLYDGDFLMPVCEDIFKAGAEWQEGQLLKGSPLPEDTVLFQKGVEEGKRLMMEESVEGEIQMRYSGGLCAKTIRAINEDKFKLGDKVRVIVLKAEEE